MQVLSKATARGVLNPASPCTKYDFDTSDGFIQDAYASLYRGNKADGATQVIGTKVGDIELPSVIEPDNPPRSVVCDRIDPTYVAAHWWDFNASDDSGYLVVDTAVLAKWNVSGGFTYVA